MQADRPIVYVLKRFPRLSETFILRELLELERHGQSIVIEALLPPEPGHDHPELAQLRARVRYLPRQPRLHHPRVTVAHVGLALRAPVTWWRAAREARRQGVWRRFLQAGLVARRSQKLGASHIHAHFATAAAEIAHAAGALSGKPFSVTAHAKDIFHRDNEGHLQRRLADAATVVTVSRYNADHLRPLLPGTPVRYVPNGVERHTVSAPCPSGPVLCVARLVPKKGIDTLIRAVALTGPEGPDLEIVGGGALLDELTELTAELGLTDRVHLLGPQPSRAVHDAFARCSMVALACRIDDDGDRDGLPTVLLEAMARGRAVITTDVVGIPELVRHERTGLLVPPDNPEALAGAINRLWAEPELAARLGEAARDVVINEYDPAASAALLMEVFHHEHHRAAVALVPA